MATKTKKRTKKVSGSVASGSKRRAGALARPKKRASAERSPARRAKARPKATSKGSAPRTAKARPKAISKGTPKAISRGTSKGGAPRTTKSSARAPSKSSGAKARGPLRRRDGAGHIDPQYAAELLAQRGTSDRDEDGSVFVGQPRSGDDLAENLGEEFVASATSGENQEEAVLDQEVPEERGGPFVESSGGTEFAWGTDASNPKNAKREPFPTT
jgi:hypothetical protein